MNPATLAILFVLGTILGSGINALAWRIETSRVWKSGRSMCPHCGKNLAWWELVPLLSFVLLRGRCSQCKARISWQYPLVELAAGGMVVLSFFTFGVSLGAVMSAIILLLLLFIYIYDGRTMLIPDPAVWSFNLLAFASLFLSFDYSFLIGGQLFTVPTWWQLAAGPLVALPFLLLWLGSRGRAMGFGDVKLALGIGWILGLSLGFSALVYAFWIGAVVSLALLGFQELWKKLAPKMSIMKLTASTEEEELSMKSAVPFGPFLILGFLIAFFSNLTLF